MPLAGSRESLLSWRRLSDLLGVLLVVIFLFNLVPSSVYRKLESTKEYAPRPPFDILDQTHDDVHGNTPLSAFEDTKSDHESIDGLSQTDCLVNFPHLFEDIDRAVSYWKGRGHTIGAEDVSINSTKAAIRILIHEDEMRILESIRSVDRLKASPDRALGVLHLLQRAINLRVPGEHLPTVEVALNFQDDADPPHEESDTHSFWTFARTIGEAAHEKLWLMPNFDFWYYGPTGSFADSKREAMQHDAPFTEKIPKLVWRGNPTFNPEVRSMLVSLTKDKPWADIKSVQFNEDPPVAIPVDDFCKYAMTVYTEGVTYSGRLKFLMNCDSLLLVPEQKYMTHYSHLLQKDGPDQNFVSVKRDWSDLEEKVKHYLSQPAEAEKIIANSIKTFRSRYTTRAALSCYLRQLIFRYATVAYTPETHVTLKNGKKKLRGVSYEKFMDSPADKNYEDES